MKVQHYNRSLLRLDYKKNSRPGKYNITTVKFQGLQWLFLGSSQIIWIFQNLNDNSNIFSSEKIIHHKNYNIITDCGYVWRFQYAIYAIFILIVNFITVMSDNGYVWRFQYADFILMVDFIMVMFEGFSMLFLYW